MQLDNTRIAVRERNLLETFDLALQVMREFWKPWLVCSLLGAAPLALLNFGLCGWMADPEYMESPLDYFRFYWTMSILVFIEAPLASSFLVAYLGPAVFMEGPTFRQVVRDVFQYAPQLFLCQLLLRGILPVWLLLLLVDRFEANPPVEMLLIPGIALYAMIVRALRPNLTEIILLERNPLRARHPGDITIGRRSAHLHDPSSGDLFVRWVGSATLVLLLIGLVLATLIAGSAVLLGDYWDAWYSAQIIYPLALWIVASFIGVVRFLSYLDLRIRHEGWEVELLLRAEGLRLQGK